MSLHREILIAGTLLGSWLGMQAIHELGHVAAACGTGGTVRRVVLHPFTISRTDLGRNPQALLVAWGGPVIGVFLPLVAWGVAASTKSPGAFVLRFFAGFCLLSNGIYLGLGSLGQIGDCGDLLRNGSQIWQLWLFGLLCSPAGICLWHGQGAEFGIGKYAKEIDGRVAWLVFGVSLALATIEFAAAFIF